MTRKYRLTFKLNRLMGGDPLELWLPVPQNTYYQKVTVSEPERVLHEPVFGASYLHEKWSSESGSLNWSIHFDVDVTERDWRQGVLGEAILSDSERLLYTSARPHVPIDGIVKEQAKKITSHLETPLEKARAVYDWVITHGERDPNQVGCGLGSVVQSIEDGHICGRCVDISSVSTALLRAAGLPAREVFGIRAGPSRWGSFMGRTGDVSQSQHCKVEFFIEGRGWIPCDPGDVLKLALDEKLEIGSDRFNEVADKLFGYAEAHWIAFNSGRDFQLKPSTGSLENYLMYPVGLSLDERLNPYSPEDFGYQYISEELPA